MKQKVKKIWKKNDSKWQEIFVTISGVILQKKFLGLFPL